MPMLPLPPPHVERSAALLSEYESVARQIRQSCHQVALLDRIHSIKVPQPSLDLLLTPTSLCIKPIFRGAPLLYGCSRGHM